MLIPVPQHSHRTCCVECGKKDGRTAAFALLCNDCKEKSEEERSK